MVFLKTAFKFQRLKIFGNHKCISRHSFEGKDWVQCSYTLNPLRCGYVASVWHVSSKSVHSFVDGNKYLNEVNTNSLVQILYFTFCAVLYFSQIIVCHVFDFFFGLIYFKCWLFYKWDRKFVFQGSMNSHKQPHSYKRLNSIQMQCKRLCYSLQ